MARFERIRDRLPSLYRPEDGADDLLSRLLRAVAGSGKRLDDELAQVMQAHWSGFADRALFSPYLRRARAIQNQPPPTPDDPELALFPYIDDLARIGALLNLPPWREPIASRETVEAYRQRIRRIVDLYRNGLGTVDALRAIIEANLPVDLTQPPGLQDRPFTLEEFAPLVRRTQMIQARGAPLELVGPLMRWTLDNDGLEAAIPTLYIQGIEPEPGLIDPTERPVIELFSASGERERLGIGYDGTLSPDQTLRLRPAHASWIAREDGLRQAESLPTETLPTDPTAPGPWQAATGAPADPAVAIVQARDRTLWLATEVAGAGVLSRFDGTAWTEILSGLPLIRCLANDDDDLLIGTAQGLLRLIIHPDGVGAPTPIPDPASLSGPAINALLRAESGQWWMGTATGLAALGAGDVLEPFVLTGDLSTPVHALHQDATGTLYVGADLGVFQYQPPRDHWYWYAGQEASDQIPDWQPFYPERSGEARNFPTTARVFLPAVHAIYRGPDSSLWIGTANGIARYRALPVRGLSYTTQLEALPDLAAGTVSAIREDQRGALWFATAQGLFRFDGRDWWQVQDDELVRLPLGSADPDRPWRFNRAGSQWESFSAGAWSAFTGSPRGAAETAVRDLVWTDQTVADLGVWDGSRFSVDAAAVVAPLRLRYKPTETAIVEGGIPAVPRLPPGKSVWRYLALEPAAPPTPKSFPAWTVEGRLLPPPPDQAAAQEGRYGGMPLPEFSHFDEAVFAYHPAARVWFAWEARRPLAVLARLGRLKADERIDPAVLDRVWAGIEQVRPAGVRALLAVDQEIVRGK